MTGVVVAKEIVDVNTSGVTDRQEIAEIVVEHFREVPTASSGRPSGTS